MLSSRKIDAWIVQRIADVYLRPAGYGGTPDGVDTVLLDLHDFWAAVHDREREFRDVWWQVSNEEGCNAVQRFPQLVHRRAPRAGLDYRLRYIVRCWQKVDKRMNLTVPLEATRKVLLAAGIPASKLLA